MTRLALLAAVILAATFLPQTPDFTARLLPPSLQHPFGTDQMGRDMLARTLQGLTLSLQTGLMAATLSTLIATLIAMASAFGKTADAIAGFITDAALSLPHLVLLVLISFALGGGTTAVVIAVSVSHWPRLARLLRSELIEVRRSAYVESSRAFGKSRAFILRHHILPHLIPQMLVGLILMFPHAILHEAGLTFLGFGLEPTTPAIGILLADSMRHISAGRWWLALFPGLCLLLTVLMFERSSKK